MRARWYDRALNTLGLVRHARVYAGLQASAFRAAKLSRLNADFVAKMLSADDEARGSLTRMRQLSRDLVNNNDYVKRIVQLIRQNVIGPAGITLQSRIPEKIDPLANETNEEIERAWTQWGYAPVTVDGLWNLIDVAQLALVTWFVDGEFFLRKVPGYARNDFAFALEMVDADRVDASLWRRRTRTQNEIRMGVEVDEWRRPVAYHILEGHPSEGGTRHIPIPAAQMIHGYIPFRVNQTRGIPQLHTAMTRLHMLGGYEEAELVAARVAACMMGILTSKTGDEFKGTGTGAKGDVEVNLEPGNFEQLPEGVDLKMFNPQHPTQAFPDFVKGMLRGASAGANLSYSSVSGDLRDVNFSSIRQGLIDERDGYRVAQAFAIGHLYEPLYRAWLPMAQLAGKLRVPEPPLDHPGLYYDYAEWQARGWQWVDPLKDVKASIEAFDHGMTTLADIAANQGKNWEDILRQQARERELAAQLKVPLGGGAAAGDTEEENEREERER